tara:strand:+ start:418 stop:2028 length:1611 start_codon:yes stop_codon:yes gene_type:complete
MNDPATGFRKVYSDLESDRSAFLERAYDAAELTIPGLLPRSGTLDQTLKTPYQGIGARGVRNISSRMLLSLFPANTSFFQLVLDEQTRQQIDQSDAETQVEAAMKDLVDGIMAEVERSHFRVAADEALKHLAVAGNALLHWEKDETPRIFNLGQYVVKRDGRGKVLRICIKEKLDRKALPPEVTLALETPEPVIGGIPHDQGTPGRDDGDAVEMYTLIEWDNAAQEYVAEQEVDGIMVPGTRQTYSEDAMPWLALRWQRISGEDYGRGMVEELLGDLVSLEGLSQAMLEGSAAMAKVLFLADPNGVTKPSIIAKAPNGAVRMGRSEDVTVVQADKRADFSTVQTEIAILREQLSFSFLLNSAIQRNAERVTAEEIRFMAQELEQTLGASYSILALDFQLPVVSLLMSRMDDKGLFGQALETGAIRPSIVTGLEALGQGHDLNRLVQFSQAGSTALTPEVFAQHIKPGAWLRAVANATGNDAGELVKTDQQIQQEQQQAQLQQAAQTVAPQIADAALNQQQAQNTEGGQPSAQPQQA